MNAESNSRPDLFDPKTWPYTSWPFRFIDMDEAKGRGKRVRRGKWLMGQTKLQGKKKNSMSEKISRRKGRTDLWHWRCAIGAGAKMPCISLHKDVGRWQEAVGSNHEVASQRSSQQKIPFIAAMILCRNARNSRTTSTKDVWYACQR